MGHCLHDKSRGLIWSIFELIRPGSYGELLHDNSRVVLDMGHWCIYKDELPTIT